MHEIETEDIFPRKLSERNRAMLRGMAESIKEGAGKERREELLAAAKEQEDYPVLRRICKEADNLLGSAIAFTMIEEVTARLEALARKHDLICECTGGRKAVRESSTARPGYQMMKSCVNEVYPGLPVIPFVLGGGTDSRYFAQMTDEIVRFSPMYAEPWQGKGVHGDNEAANIDAVKDAAVCYEHLLSAYL